MTQDNEALELVARAIWDNHPQNQTPVNQLTGQRRWGREESLCAHRRSRWP